MTKNTNISTTSTGYFLFIVIFLGMISAFGPFITDMYLPTLPAMQEAFHTSEPMVQLGLSTAMIGLALGQFFFGPISEKFGRKPVLIIAMVIFTISALASIFSPTIEFFLVCRVFQGIGGSGGIVLARSISTDSYSGHELLRMMGIIGAVHGVTPVAAPVIGGLVGNSVGWRGIFIILLGLGIVLLAMCFVFKETLPPAKRMQGSIWKSFAGFKVVLKIRAFVYPLLAFACTYGILFGYIASSPFIIQTRYEYSQVAFSIIFAINACGLGFGATMAAKFKQLHTSLMTAATLVLIFTVIQLIGAFFLDNFWFYETVMFLTLVCVGMIFTSASTMAMEAGRASIGSASAIVGGIGFILGGAISPIVGLGDIMVTTGIVYVASAAIVFMFASLVYQRLRGQSVI